MGIPIFREDEEIYFEDSGRFKPLYTPEVSRWEAESAFSVAVALGGGVVDERVLRTVSSVLSAIPLFVPSDVVTKRDGCQVASFTIGQLASVFGKKKGSDQAVQRAVRLLCLRTNSKDGTAYIRACERLERQRSGIPILRCIEKSRGRGHASRWAMVGIGPREKRDEWPENLTCTSALYEIAGCSGSAGSASAPDSKPREETGSPFPEDDYQEFVKAFPKSPGPMDQETRLEYKAARKRVVSLEELNDKVRECQHGSGRARYDYPLSFLKDIDLMPGLINKDAWKFSWDKMRHDKGEWEYDFGDGWRRLGNLIGSATPAEARLSVIDHARRIGLSK